MRKLAIAILLLLVGAGTSGFWFWRQATYLPDWYTQSPPSPDEDHTLNGQDIDQDSERQSLKVKLARQVKPVPIASSSTRSANGASVQNTHEVRLEAQAFNEFVVSSIPANQHSNALLPAVKGINSEIENQKLKVGLVVNTAEIPFKELPKASRSQLEQTLNTFPFLKNQEIYLGIVGQPRLESGQVVLGKNAQVQVGGLTLDLADFSKRIGVPVTTLEQKINLQLGQLNVKEINFSQDTAILQGTLK
ncbi:MAG: hypothetical protein ACFCU8_20885 [Thermosynechococcaceae cyanobacterium]